MLSRQCPFCENVNPPNSRFCNACGVKLHAALCPHCGAVNVLSATVCVSCAAELPDASSGAAAAPSATGAVEQPIRPVAAIEPMPADAGPPGGELRVASLETVPPLAFSVHFDRDHTVKIDRSDSSVHVNSHTADWSASRAVERRDLASPHPPLPELTVMHSGSGLVPDLVPAVDPRTSYPVLPDPSRYRQYAMLLGIVVVVLLGGSAYYLHRAHTMAEMSALIASGRELKERDTSTEPQSTGAPTVAPATTAPAAVAAPAASPPPTPPADEQRTLRPSRGQIGTTEAAAAVAAAAARSKTGNARSETPPQGLGPCTEAVAALGLCTRDPPPRPRP